MSPFRFLLWLLLFCPAALHSLAQNRVSLYYPTNVYQLSAPQKSLLDSLIYRSWIQDGDSLIILGYADYQGNTEENLLLSQRRADAILEHLHARGWTSERVHVEGRGELKSIDSAQGGVAEHRRIDLIRGDLSAPPLPSSPPPHAQRDHLPPAYKAFLSAQPGETMALENLLFYPGIRRVIPSSLPVLDTLYQFLHAHPEVRISLEGHVCCVSGPYDAFDEETMELALSHNRARFVYQYLVDRGIDPNRLQYQGFGHSRPKVPVENTDEDRQANRRVEIRLLKNGEP